MRSRGDQGLFGRLRMVRSEQGGGEEGEMGRANIRNRSITALFMMVSGVYGDLTAAALGSALEIAPTNACVSPAQCLVELRVLSQCFNCLVCEYTSTLIVSDCDQI